MAEPGFNPETDPVRLIFKIIIAGTDKINGLSYLNQTNGKVIAQNIPIYDATISGSNQPDAVVIDDDLLVFIQRTYRLFEYLFTDAECCINRFRRALIGQ